MTNRQDHRLIYDEQLIINLYVIKSNIQQIISKIQQIISKIQESKANILNSNPMKSPSQQPIKAASQSQTNQAPANPKQIQFLRQQERLQKQRIRHLYQQINIQKQKSQRMQVQHRQKLKKVQKKVFFQSGGNVYQQADGDDQQYKQVPVDGDVYLGSRVFMVNCAGCHALETVTNNQDNAPSLGLIYNRKVGTDLNFFSYSKSILEGRFFWTPINLYNFLAEPTKLLPGNRCGLAFKPIKDQSQRADLISFMKEFTKELQLNVRIELIKKEGYEMYQTKIYAEKVKNQRINKDLNRNP